MSGPGSVHPGSLIRWRGGERSGGGAIQRLDPAPRSQDGAPDQEVTALSERRSPRRWARMRPSIPRRPYCSRPA